jgi:hypothetical protein
VFDISGIFIRHLLTLGLRTILLITAVVLRASGQEQNAVFLFACWLMLFAGMVLRLFPNEFIAQGARKHYISSDPSADGIQQIKALNLKAFRAAIFWIVFNAAVFVVLHMLDLLTPQTAMIIVLFYSVCDVAFILFFCPFRKFFMHNHCCSECRIYNWDYLMMVTPLVVFPSVYSVSLIVTALAVFLCWEYAVYKKPHSFLQNADCAKCKDKLCRIKRLFKLLR